MKVFFDTNAYVAEALHGKTAEQLVEATVNASWKIFASSYLLTELDRVLVEKLGFSRRLAVLTRQRISRRATIIDPGAYPHSVPNDANDSPILAAALASGSDYLVTNDPHLLVMNPYEGLRIISLSDYHQLLFHEGLLR
jgi:putative PIN family toxin of toxin-antitoxin system